MGPTDPNHRTRSRHATVGACGGFAAICGSSVATAATFSAVAYPEMRRFGYPQSFATGVIAAGGTLGAMLPPSTVLAVYGIITEQDIGKLFIAGIIPGLLAMTMYMITIALIGVTGSFYANAISFLFVIAGLFMMRPDQFFAVARAPRP